MPFLKNANMGRRRKGNKMPPRTVRHLMAEPPDGTQFIQGPDFSVPRGRRPVRRLSFSGHEPVPYDPLSLLGVMLHPNNRHVRWMLDANMFIAETDDQVWKALLAERGRLVLAIPVFHELDAWLRSAQTNHVAHHAVTAALNGEPSARVCLLDLPRGCPEQVAVGEFYINLLGMRKKTLCVATEKLKEQLGREPTNQELSNYCKDVLGMRGQLLARKGRDAKMGANKLNDEVLVMLAIMEAIYDGREVAILTRDEDVLDQFYKAWWLIETHYRGMLLADAYRRDPLSFQTQKTVDARGEAFEGDVLLLRKPSEHLRELLPQAWTPAPVHCILLKDSVTQLTFCAEREIRRLFEIKANTGGMNTDGLEGRNCHAYLGDRFIQQMGNWAAIARDLSTRVPNTEAWLSVVDVNLAVMSDERFIRGRVVDPQDLILPASEIGPVG